MAKRLLVLAILLLLPIGLFAQVRTTVTGTVFDPSGALATSGSVQFTLQPTSSSLGYTITGMGVLAPISTSCAINGSGQLVNISGSGSCLLWANTAIAPASSCYAITLFPNGVQTGTLPAQQISGTNYDLSTPTACPTNPVIMTNSVIDVAPINGPLVPVGNKAFPLGGPTAYYSGIYVDQAYINNLNGTMASVTAQAFQGPDLGTNGGEVYNVMAYGAKCNGLNDDTVTIQSALNAVPSIGGTVYIPPVQCNISAPLVTKPGTVLQGASQYQTVLNNTNTSGFPAIHTVSLSDGSAVAYYTTIQDLTIAGNSASGDGIYIYAPFVVNVERVRVIGHGGIGIHALNGTGGNPIGQNVFVKDSYVFQNQGGGIKMDTAVIGSFENNSVNSNGHYCYYFVLVTSATIRGGECSGYYYGALIASNQAVPVALNGGEVVSIDGLYFENNGGNGATPNCNIRTGYNGDTQMNASATTATLRVLGARFAAALGQSGALNDICLSFAQNVLIEGNTFEKNPMYPNVVNAYSYGTLAAQSKIQRYGNLYGLPGSTLDAIDASAYSGVLIGDDDLTGDGRNKFNCQLDSSSRICLRMSFPGEVNDRIQITGAGISVGPGTSNPIVPAIASDAFGPVFMPASVQPSTAGSVAGDIIVTMPFQGVSKKEVIIYLNGLNGTVSANFPVNFTVSTPACVASSTVSCSVITSVTQSTVALSTMSPTTGLIFIEGF